MKTKVISVHFLRRRARAIERELQRDLDNRQGIGWRDVRADLEAAGVPPWANGVRVEKAGPFQWAVVATSDRGR